MYRKLLALLLALVAAGVVAAGASSGGVTAATLAHAGWTCIIPTAGDNVHCAPPGGLARVVSGEAETMTFRVFRASDGTPVGNELIVRADIYKGQPCPTDPPGRYTYLGPILGLDYYACHRYDSSF